MLLFVLYLSEYDNDCLSGLPCNRNSFMGIIYFMRILENIRLLESHTFLLCKNGLYSITLNPIFLKYLMNAEYLNDLRSLTSKFTMILPEYFFFMWS